MIMIDKQRLTLLVSFVWASLLLGSSWQSQAAPSGHTSWGPWEFDWEVREAAGLNLMQVHYNGDKILHKVNVPVVRVHYLEPGLDPGIAGPYADKMDPGSLQQISTQGDPRVRQRAYQAGGRNWLEIAIFDRIGEYRLYQVYYMSQDGWIHPVLWSRGWSDEATHRHHTYLRLDCDIDGPLNDQTFVYNQGSGNHGWGPGWQQYSNELETVKNASTNRRWFVRDSNTGDGLWIIPSSNDGSTTSFAPNDAAARVYHPSEVTGNFGDAWPWGARDLLKYNNGENIKKVDGVFWYIHHIFHEWKSPQESIPDDWHWAGPWLKVHE